MLPLPQECSQKQQCYIQLLADLIAQCTNRQELAQQDLHNPVKELLTTTLDVAIFGKASRGGYGMLQNLCYKWKSERRDRFLITCTYGLQVG